MTYKEKRKQKKDIRLQKKQMKYQKKRFLELVQNQYSVYDAAFMNLFIYQYIIDLYEYHSSGLNIQCDKEDHEKLMESLTEAYELVKKVQALEKTNMYADDNYNYYKDNIKQLFMIIATNFDEWWD